MEIIQSITTIDIILLLLVALFGWGLWDSGKHKEELQDEKAQLVASIERTKVELKELQAIYEEISRKSI